MIATNQAFRKTSKSQLNEACDSFFWFLDWITGGTREETLRQADGAISDLEAKAALVTKLAANPAKLCAADAWLMQRAASVNARVESYRNSYVGKYESFKAEQAAKRAQEEQLDRLIFVASAVCGEEVTEILTGAETLTPSNIIFHQFC
jgi:hypothetical protein